MQQAARVAPVRHRNRAPQRVKVARKADQATRPARRQSNYAASFYKAIAVTLAITALAMVNLSQRVLIAQNGLAITDLQRKIQSEKTDRQQLEMSLLVLESPGRIRRQAEVKLRMVQPERVSYMQVPLSTPRPAGQMAVASKTNTRYVRPLAKQGIFEVLLEKVAGQVQLLPLGNVGMPVN